MLIKLILKLISVKYKTIKISVILFLILTVYLPILRNDFLFYWDDQWMVFNRYTEGGINFSNLWAILTEFYHGQFSPVNEYMYLFIYSIFGYNPFVFHLASLLLHAGNVCLVYLITIRIFDMRTANDLLRHGNDTQKHAIAFVTALLFAVHPMNVETVAWISASKIVVYAFFYLLATYAFLTYLVKGKTTFYYLTLLLFALSFGGKEQAVIFPVWLLMLYWLLGRSFKERKVWIEVTPFFILALSFGFVTLLSQSASGSGILSHSLQYPLWQRVVLGCYSLVEYIVKFFVPYNLLYIYPFPMLIGESLPGWMLVYPALLLIVIVSLWQYLKKTPLAIGLLFFLIHIAIVLHIIPLSRFAVIADRYIYLSGIGLSFIIAYYFVVFATGKRGFIKKMIIACFSLIVLTLGVYSNLRCRDWKDTDSIKRELRELLKQRDDYVPENDDFLKDFNR